MAVWRCRPDLALAAIWRSGFQLKSYHARLDSWLLTEAIRRCADNADHKAIEMPERESSISSTPKEASRVLVVEDDAFIAMLYGDLLAEIGHTICAIETTEAGAVAAAARHKPDLMIVDAGLRDGNGLSAVTEILRSGFVPHVFVTGDERTVQASLPDAVVLQKPFRDPDLARAIQRALSAAPFLRK
jgi:CheY-like chemotaxis protein